MTSEDMNFPLLRMSLAPEYAEAAYPELIGIVEAVYGPGAVPEDVEGMFDDIGRALSGAGRSIAGFAQQAAPVVARALPNIAQGAAGGAAFGPWGALAGAIAGGASGIMQQSRDPTVRGIGSAIHQVGSLASSVRGGGMGALGAISTGAQGAAPGGAGLMQSIFGAGRAGSPGSTGRAGGGAAAGLMGLLSRPETLQALLSSTMGAFGNRNLSISGQQVPVHSMLAALSNMAGRAASEAAEFAGDGEATPAFATSAGEALGLDPESSEGRTDALLTLLALTPSIWAASRPAQPVVVNVPGDPLRGPTGESYESGWPEWPEALWEMEAEYA